MRYFDHNATTPVAPEALAAFSRACMETFGNPSSIHTPGQRARHALEAARESLAGMLGGSVVIETVFNIPGMGRLLVQSVTRRDFPVVQAAVMVVAAVEVLVMLLVDILYVYIDPRVRYGSD